MVASSVQMPGLSADESNQCESERMAHIQKDGGGGLLDAAKPMQLERMKKTPSQQEPAEQSSCQSTLPQTTMPPLGLGLGSGLGSQHGKMTKSNPPTAAATAFMESRARGVNARDEKGRTALHFACGMASPEFARLLLEAGADANLRDKDGFTPIHMAAGYGRCHCVKLLLEHGAGVLFRERAGRTPLELALEIRDGVTQGQELSIIPRGDMDLTIKLLTDAESKDTVAAREKMLPENWSTSMSYVEELPALLQSHSNSNSNLPKKTLRTTALGNALSAACRGGQVDVAERLLSSGAQVDAHDLDGATPLLAAADSGFAKCVQLLLKHGAQADAKDRVGVTALIAAAYNGHTDCVKVLLEHGAAVDARSHGGVTPLIAAAEGRNAFCTQVLVQAGAQVDAKTSEGKTALMHAVSRNCIEATVALLVGGADLNAADGDGCTALHHGARNNSGDCLRILLEKEADVTRKCRRGRTPIQEAPKDSLAAKILEDRWKQLELEIAQRQAELLNLFAQDTIENVSNTSKKPGTRHVREKKKGKRKKEMAEKIEVNRQELTKVVTELVVEGGSLAVDMLSSSGSEIEGNTLEVEMDQTMRGPHVGPEEEAAFEKGADLYIREGTEGNKLSLCGSPRIDRGGEGSTLKTVSVLSSSPGSIGLFPAAEDACESGDKWIKVDGKGGNHQRLMTPTASVKTHTSQSKSQGGTKSGLLTLKSLKNEELSSSDHSPTEKKTSVAQRNKQNEGIFKNLKEDDCRDSDSSPWVQALLRRNNSVGDGPSIRPHGRADMRPSLQEPKGEDTWEEVNVETVSENRRWAEEKLSDRVRRIEQELEQARQAARVEMRKVRDLELSVSARGLGKAETNNSLQVVELTQALEVQFSARVQAENAKTELEARVQELESVVSSQRKALEAAEAEVAELKLQMLRREEQHKQECESQHRESVAAAMAAAAASWRAWELQHTRDSLQGWLPECAETSPGGFAPTLDRSGHKVHGGPLTPDSVLSRKKEGEQVEKESFEWRSAATAAAMAAASMLGSKSCGCLTHPLHILQGLSQSPASITAVSESTRKPESPAACNWAQREGSGKEETHEIPAGQTPSKAGKGLGPGMTRSVSESSLNLMEGVIEQQQQQQHLLPFIPTAGPKTDPVNGWFSLVPSPVD